MDLRTPCLVCGKILRFPAQFAGQATLCPACGSLNMLPDLTGTYEPAAPTPPGNPIDPDDYVNLDEPDSREEPSPPPLALPVRRRWMSAQGKPMASPWRKAVLIPALIGLAGIIIAALTVAIFMPRQKPAPTWEDENRQQIIALKQQAEFSAVSGHYREAFERYQELERLVNGHEIADPFLHGELSLAWKHREQVWENSLHPPAKTQDQPAMLPAAGRASHAAGSAIAASGAIAAGSAIAASSAIAAGCPITAGFNHSAPTQTQPVLPVVAARTGRRCIQ